MTGATRSLWFGDSMERGETWATAQRCTSCRNLLATDGNTKWCYRCEEKELTRLLTPVPVPDYYTLYRYYYISVGEQILCTGESAKTWRNRMYRLRKKYGLPPRKAFHLSRS